MEIGAGEHIGPGSRGEGWWRGVVWENLIRRRELPAARWVVSAEDAVRRAGDGVTVGWASERGVPGGVGWEVARER